MSEDDQRPLGGTDPIQGGMGPEYGETPHYPYHQPGTPGAGWTGAPTGEQSTVWVSRPVSTPEPPVIRERPARGRRRPGTGPSRHRRLRPSGAARRPSR